MFTNKGGDFIRITLKAARINAGLKLVEAAEKIGVSYVTLHNWENGKTHPNLEKLKKLGELYELDFTDLRL